MKLLLAKLTIHRSSLWFQLFVLGISTLLCGTAAFVYWFQPDSWAAFLLYPRWVWLVLGLLLALLALTTERKRPASAVAILWLFYAIVFVQELSSLTRWRPSQSEASHVAHERGEVIRVISLNCSGGNEDAAAEVIPYAADLVLFQESPVRPNLRNMAASLIGSEASALCGTDVSIIAKGEISPVPLPEPWNTTFSHARIRLVSGLKIEAIVVRLQPYDFRGDLWSPECWRKHHANRMLQQAQIQWLARHIEEIPADVPLIVAGDFNMPGGDHSLRPLQPRLRDAFRDAGKGWGDTMDNVFPILRIDQVWCSAHFRADSVIAHRTIHSDHRMVVADLSLPSRSLPEKLE